MTQTKVIWENRIEHIFPNNYRLVKKNGELILQGAFQFVETLGDYCNSGFTWRDIPTVDLDENNEL